MIVRPRSIALLLLVIGAQTGAQEPTNGDIVTFLVCSTWDCLDGPGIDQKFEIWANTSTDEGREILRLANEQLTAMERHPEWVPRTPIICSKPQQGPGPAGLKNRDHDWHCRPDHWAFFRNADKECGGSAGLFDALPERYIDRNFCPWSSYLHRCEGCEPITGRTNGTYLVHFFANASEYQLELAANRLGLMGANITKHLPHYGPVSQPVVTLHRLSLAVHLLHTCPARAVYILATP
jgi:hypothetical protein